MTAAPRRVRGAALMQALLLLVVATALAASAAARVQRTADTIVLDGARATASAAADGGVELARAALAREPDWHGTTAALDGTELDVQVGAGPSDAERCVVVVARGARATRRVEALLRLAPGRLPRIVSWREGG